MKQGEFAFVNLPPGPYVLKFVGGGAYKQFVYFNYPNDAPDKKDRQVINLSAGQKVRNLVIRFP